MIVDDVHREAEKNLLKKLNLELKSTTFNYNKNNYLTIFTTRKIQKRMKIFLTNVKLNNRVYFIK